MKVYTQAMLDEYLRDDWVRSMVPEASTLQSDIWLRISGAKRMIWADLYGDLWNDTGMRLLDIGGGQHTMPMRCWYRNVNLPDDWHSLRPFDADVIVANDIFPNNDQRLAEFIERWLPHAGEIRMSITVMNVRHPGYRCMRLDGTEEITVAPWSGVQMQRFLGLADAELLSAESIFANGRTVIRWDLKHERR